MEVQFAQGSAAVLATTTQGVTRELAVETETGRLRICAVTSSPFVSPFGGVNPPIVTGSWSDGTAMASLAAALDLLGFIIDNTAGM